jgi:ubiquinone/menaquinone biosynthesis C-methylase UbiE
VKCILSLQYFTDREYERAFFEFGNIRGKIADKMRQLSPLKRGNILDFLSGHALLSAEMAIRFPKSGIFGIGLSNDIETWKQVRDSRKYSQGVWSNFHYLLSDATRMPLKSSSCDMVVNFLGLEDLNMTCGWSGVEQAISEIDRITKRGALIQISMAEYGKTPEEVLAEEIWNTVGLNAVFQKMEDYVQRFEEFDIHPIESLKFEHRRKMTAKQAREELRFACEEAPQIFSTFDVRAIKFDELWEKFGKRIEECGVAYWPQIRVMILAKK